MKRIGFIKENKLFGKIPIPKKESQNISLRPRYKSKYTFEGNLRNGGIKRKLKDKEYVGVKFGEYNPTNVTIFHEKNNKRKEINLKKAYDLVKKIRVKTKR